MAEPSETPGTAPVSDHRPKPPGVLPRGIQTWIMVGLAVGIVLIILVAGQPEPPRGQAPTAAAAGTPNADRLRDYQERLRSMEARQAQDAQAATAPQAPAEPRFQEAAGQVPPDPVETERKRREYESLFSSNVVLSRRPQADRPDTGQPATSGSPGNQREPSTPSLEDIAAAVMRATGGAAGPPPDGVGAGVNVAAPSPTGERTAPGTNSQRTSDRTEPISATGPLHVLLEGSVIDTVLTNRLDGGAAAPVNCLVTNAVYSHSGQHILIPAGARILGETRPVQALGETRLAVAFHRMVMPDGSTQRLDQFLGLNQIGDAGLRDKVNQHYWSTFGAAAAVGLIGGLSQAIGTAGVGSTGDRTVVIAGGAADSASQASLQVMSRFLNRLPTVTIREGHRVKVYLTSDLRLPAYAELRAATPF